MTSRALGLGLLAGLLAGAHGSPALAQPGTLDMNEVLRRNQEIYAPYNECVQQHRAEMESYHRAREVSEYVKIKANLRARDSHEPDAVALEGQVDQALFAAWINYQRAGGTATLPENVVVPPIPCQPPVPMPSDDGGTQVQTQIQFRKSIRIQAPPAEPPR